MKISLLNMAALAAILATGSAFAADNVPPVVPPAPAAPAATTSSAPTATMPTKPMPSTASPAVAKTESTNTVPPMPTVKADVAVSKPMVPHRMVSACTMSIEKAEKMLTNAKVSAESIAMAWQHLDAAKQDRISHQAAACKTESNTAANMLSGKV